jgi:hypothetical protein
MPLRSQEHVKHIYITGSRIFPITTEEVSEIMTRKEVSARFSLFNCSFKDDHVLPKFMWTFAERIESDGICIFHACWVQVLEVPQEDG